MKTLLISLIMVLSFTVHAQNIVLAGAVEHADTMNITVWSNGRLILSNTTVEPVYAIILGDEPHYTLQYECRGQVKYATLITIGMKSETINLPVSFSNSTHVIIYKEKHGVLAGRRKHRATDPITYMYYGFHSYRKQF